MPGKSRYYTPKQIKKCRQMRLQGKKIKEIIAATGMKKSAISWHTQDCIASPIRKVHRKRITQDIKDKIIDRFMGGGKADTIAADLGISRATVHRLVKEEMLIALPNENKPKTVR